LGGITPVMSHIIYALGPSMWVLYGFFQVEWALAQAMEDITSIGGFRIGRLTGLGPTGLALFTFLLLRFGIRGSLDLSKPWRLAILLAAVATSLFGGFRSISLLLVIIFFIQFWLEGLHKTRLLPCFLIGATLVLTVCAPVANKLPLSAQRCLTVLPFFNVDPVVRADAMVSTDWRLRMWKIVMPDIPKYLFVGKGCGADGKDYWLAAESQRRGFAQEFDLAMISGDYHNGPLSVIIPFGLLGTLAFTWFLVASVRVLLRNYRYGEPSLRNMNTF